MVVEDMEGDGRGDAFARGCGEDAEEGEEMVEV